MKESSLNKQLIKRNDEPNMSLCSDELCSCRWMYICQSSTEVEK